MDAACSDTLECDLYTPVRCDCTDEELAIPRQNQRGARELLLGVGRWALGVGAALLVSILSSTVFRDTADVGMLGKYAPWITLLAWYFFSARKQSRYVKTELEGTYEKKGWLKPVLAGVVLLFLVIGGLGFYTSGATSLAFDEGQAFGQSSDLSACYSKSINRMQSCSGFKCEMYEIGFAKGCAATAESDHAFCQAYPSSVLDAAGKIKEVCQHTKFSEKGCYNSLKSYVSKCLK